MIGAAALLLLAQTAAAAPAVFAVHIGVNVAPAESGLEPLRYADDDAVRLFDLTRRYAVRSVLLATLDDGWSGQPDLTAALENRPGDAPVVLLYHGVVALF